MSLFLGRVVGGLGPELGPWERCRFRRAEEVGWAASEVPIQLPGRMSEEQEIGWNRDLGPRSPMTAPICGASGGSPSLSHSPPLPPWGLHTGAHTMLSSQPCPGGLLVSASPPCLAVLFE